MILREKLCILVLVIYKDFHHIWLYGGNVVHLQIGYTTTVVRKVWQSVKNFNCWHNGARNKKKHSIFYVVSIHK